MATSTMATGMARLHMCTGWTTLDARHCRPRADKLALFFSSSSSSSSCTRSEALAFPGAARPGRRRICGSVSALALTPDFFHIPYTEGIPVGSKLKLFNLPYNCDHDALIEHFGTCGAFVESLEVTNNSEEDGNASGFVVLGDLDQACAAVAQLDGARFQGKCVRMDFVERRPYENKNPNKTRSKHSRTPSQVANRVYIGNLPWRVDSTTLQQLFSIHGTVQEAEVMRDRINGRSRGYGFVLMSSAAEMEKAIAALDGCEIEGRSLKVSLATARGTGVVDA